MLWQLIVLGYQQMQWRPCVGLIYGQDEDLTN